MQIPMTRAIECVNKVNRDYLNKAKELIDEYKVTGDETKLKEARFNVDVGCGLLNISDLFLQKLIK